MKIRPVTFFSPIPTITPSDPEPPAKANMLVWYRGDSLQDSGGTATAWNDKTGNGINLSTYGNPTVTDAADMNNRRVAHLSETGGVRPYFGADASPSTLFPLTSALTLIVVCQLDFSTTAVQQLPIFCLRTTAGLQSLFFKSDYTWTYQYLRQFSTEKELLDVWGGTDLDRRLPRGILSTITTAPSRTIYHNNILVDSTSQSVNLGLTADAITIGSEMFGDTWNDRGNTNIAEVILYNKALDSTERGQFWSYLDGYYGIS